MLKKTKIDKFEKRLKKDSSKINLITHNDPFSSHTEQYRTLATNLKTLCEEKEIKDLVITSSLKAEGKSTTSSNLSVVLGGSGMKTLLIDADLRKPKLAKVFDLPKHEGLADILSNQSVDPMAFIHPIKEVSNLYVLPAGKIPNTPAELLNLDRMEELIEIYRENFDFIIYDMPPVLMVTDALVLSQKVGGTVVVVREQVSEKRAIKRTKQLLELANVNILGVVYNGVHVKEGDYYYYQYSY